MRLAIVFLAAAAVFGQTGGVPEVVAGREVDAARALLDSGDPLRRAWGAYLVGKYGLAEMAPRLGEELARLRTQAGTVDLPARSTIHTLLDALIQLRAPAGDEVLRDFRKSYRPEVIVWAAQDVGAYRELLLEWMGEDDPTAAWLAVRNLLTEARAPGVAARLLAETTFRVEVTVVDQGYGFSPGEGGGWAGCGTCGWWQDYPPAAIYELTTSPARGDVLLAAGNRPVYYRRTVVPVNRQVGCGTNGEMFDRDVERGNYLRRLARSPEPGRELVRPHVSVAWNGGEKYVAAVEEAVAVEASRVRALLDELTQGELLTCAEREPVRVPVTVSVEDGRQNGRNKVLPGVGGRVVEGRCRQ